MFESQVEGKLANYTTQIYTGRLIDLDPPTVVAKLRGDDTVYSYEALRLFKPFIAPKDVFLVSSACIMLVPQACG